MRYILRVTSEDAFDEVRERIARAVPAAEEPMASIAEKLIQQGIEQGIDRGRIQALRDALGRLLEARFGPVGPEVTRRLDAATLEELEGWIDRVVTADHVDAVFEPSA
jgi:hypothetical protein